MTATLHEYESEFEVPPDILDSGLRVQLRVRFLYQGFLTVDKFLDEWIHLSGNGRIGTTLNFRKRFCDGNQYQIQLPSKKWARVGEAWGYAIPYVIENGKPKLLRMLPRSWLLKQVGRSVKAPAFCAVKP